MEFNKEEILDSIDTEVRSSFKKLLESVISILQESVKSGACIPTREILKVIPSYKGFTNIKDEKPDLYRLIPRKIWDLDEYKQCSEIFDKNELLGSQETSSNSFLVLPSFITDYLDNIDPEFIIFDQGHFNSLFDEYKNALLSLTYDTLYICPLFGFESEVDNFKLDENLTIRKITEDERNEIWNRVQFFGSNHTLDSEVVYVKYVIEQRVIQIKNIIPKPNVNLIPTAIFALRLLKSGSFLADIQLHKSLLPWGIRTPIIYGTNNRYNLLRARNKYLLNMDDTEALQKYYLLSKSVQNLRSKNKYKQLFRAIEWFNRYHNESNIEHQFIFLMLLMEALCSDAVETQYRLSTRISLVIGENDDDRLKIIDKFKELYGGPRKIVHGEDTVIEEKHVLTAEDYSRRLLQKFILISLNGYIIQNVRALIDGALVSETNRKKLFEALNFDETYDKLNMEVKKLDPSISYLKDELYEIKTDLDNFTVYNTNKGFIYKSIVINGFEGIFTKCLWDEIIKFYTSYFCYLTLLKKSSDCVISIIREVIHKIKTEEEASKWAREYLERVNHNAPFRSVDAGGKGYNLSSFLRKDTLKNIPEINDEEYLFLADNLNQWDLKITLEDIRRSERSIKDILQEIHNFVGKEELIREIRDSRVENLKLISSLIKHIDEV